MLEFSMALVSLVKLYLMAAGAAPSFSTGAGGAAIVSSTSPDESASSLTPHLYKIHVRFLDVNVGNTETFLATFYYFGCILHVSWYPPGTKW